MKTIFISLALFAFAASAVADSASLQVGSPAPTIAANDDAGNLWRLSDHLGKSNVIVYFYPAAMTGGCTKQACAYRDHSAALNDVDAIVVGVSGDPVSNLKHFKEAHGLNFPLLSDIDGAIARSFGVPTKAGGSIEREIAGAMLTLTRGLTTMRWTFVVGKDGTIVYKNDAVNAAEDSAAVIAELKRIAGAN